MKTSPEVAGALLAAIALVFGACAACARPQTGPTGAIVIDVTEVPLNAQDPSQTAVGNFTYAGGLALTTRQTDRLHGLSDLEVDERGRLLAVGDIGVLLRATLVFGTSGRLTGIEAPHLTLLTGVDGSPLADKTDADAEGLALLPNDDLLVSFERRHRILLYPASGGPPRAVPAPDVPLPENNGLEALGPDPEAGSDAYIVGAEMSGATWSCRVSAGCVDGPIVDKPDEFGLVAIRRLPGGRTVYLLRAYDPLRGNRTSLRVVGPAGLLDRLDMAPPMTIDNFEGVAAVPGADGTVRFYLLSDDNESRTQRTLLLAFDWQPRP